MGLVPRGDLEERGLRLGEVLIGEPEPERRRDAVARKQKRAAVRVASAVRRAEIRSSRARDGGHEGGYPLAIPDKIAKVRAELASTGAGANRGDLKLIELVRLRQVVEDDGKLYVVLTATTSIPARGRPPPRSTCVASRTG